jgi:phosphate/sulfate permease
VEDLKMQLAEMRQACCESRGVHFGLEWEVMIVLDLSENELDSVENTFSLFFCVLFFLLAFGFWLMAAFFYGWYIF